MWQWSGHTSPTSCLLTDNSESDIKSDIGADTGFYVWVALCYPFTLSGHVGQYQSGSMLHRDQYQRHSHKTLFPFTNAQIVLTVFVSRVTKKCWTNVDKRQSGWLHWYFSFGCIAVTEIINLAPILSWSDSRTMVELTKPWEASGHFAQFNIFYPMTRGDRKYRSQSKLWHKILHL